MEALTLIPRLPAFFLVLLLVAAFLFLWRCHWNYSRHLWGGSFYLANRLIAAAILIFCLYHPSLRSSQPFLDKKVLAVARDTSLSMTIPDAGENVSRGQATNFLLSDLELTGFLEDHFDVHWYDFDSSVTPAQSPIYDVNSKTEGPLTAMR